MDCFCGCGTKVSRKLVPANLQAGKVALELLAWDKERTANPHAPQGETTNEEALISRGAACYQRLVSAVHGEEGADPLPGSEEWLRDSLRERSDRPEMTEKGSFLSTRKLRLTDKDIERLDRLRPERSFSAGLDTAPPIERAAEDPVEQLQGLRELHAAGALTDAEFAEAKARVIARLS
jgi:hypothetical protein